MEPVEYPLDGILDLHVFHPHEATDVVREYLHACLAVGIFRVRIIHGKGTGKMRKRVHGVLDTIAEVDRYALATDTSGWGATIVWMKPPSAGTIV